MTTDELAELFAKHKEYVIQTVCRTFKYNVEYTLCEDLYTELWPKIEAMKCIRLKSFRNYLIRALRNKVLNHQRDSAASNDVLDRALDSLHEPEVLCESDRVNWVLQQHESTEATAEYAEQAIGTLPPTVRYFAEQYHLGGKTIQGIAQENNVSSTWVYKLLTRAKVLMLDYARKHPV